MQKHFVNLLIATLVSIPLYFGFGNPFIYSIEKNNILLHPAFHSVTLGLLVLGLFYLAEYKPKVANIVQYIFALPGLAYGGMALLTGGGILINGADQAGWGILFFLLLLVFAIYPILGFFMIWARIRWILGKGIFGIKPLSR